MRALRPTLLWLLALTLGFAMFGASAAFAQQPRDDGRPAALSADGSIADDSDEAEDSALEALIGRDPGSVFWGVRAPLLRPLELGLSALLNPVHGVPQLPGSETVGVDVLFWRTQIEAITLSVDESEPDGSAALSGAFYRLSTALTYGFARDWDITVRLPGIVRTGTTRIVQGGQTLIDSRSSHFAIAEPTVSLRWRMLRIENRYPFRGLVASAAIKIPLTVQDGTFARSGEPDFHGSLAAAFGQNDWRAHFGIGFSYLGLGSPNENYLDVRADLENVWFIGGNAAVRFASDGEGIDAVAIFQGHLYGSPFLDVSTPLAGTFGDLFAAVRLQVNDTEITLGFGETISHFSIDLVAFLEFAWYFDFRESD